MPDLAEVCEYFYPAHAITANVATPSPPPPTQQHTPLRHVRSTEKFIRKKCTNLAEIYYHYYPNSFSGPPYDVTISAAGQQFFFQQYNVDRKMLIIAFWLLKFLGTRKIERTT